MPKLTLPSIEEFSDEDRAFAVKNDDGTFTIDVRPTAVVTNFRDNNLQLLQRSEDQMKKIQALGATFGIDVKELGDLDEAALGATWSELNEIKKQVTDGKLVADSSLESAVAQRVAEHKAESDRRISELTKKIGEKDTDFQRQAAEMNDYILTQQLTMAVLAEDSPVRADALPDIISRGKGAFKVDGNRKLIAVDGEGRTLFGPDATNPLTEKEWLGQQVEKSSYLGKSSKGGGADNYNGNSNLDSFASGADTPSYVEARFKQANVGAS